MAKANKATLPKLEVLQIPLHRILPDEHQPRQSFDEAENIELAKSVAKDGILQPILVRPMTGKEPLKYMVVFGHRRLWAAKYNKMVSIPAQVKDLTDDEALEIQIIENLQRKNINPMEESDAFSRLINKKITTAEQIADKLGVSTKYVYDRMALQKVIDPVKEQLRKGIMSISHGKQFARLQPKDQDVMWDNLFLADVDDNGNQQVHDDVPVAKMKSLIHDSFSRVLADAIFSTSDAKLLPKAGACEKCQKRSGCNLLLFDDIQQKDLCFDGDCYNKKQQAHLDQLITKLDNEGKKVARISLMWNSELEGVLNRNEWEYADEEEADTHGVIVEVSKYSHYHADSKLGDIISIKLCEEDEEDGHEHPENSDEVDELDIEQGAQPRGMSAIVAGTGANRQVYVDHNDQIQKRLLAAIVSQYKDLEHFNLDLESLLRESLRKTIWNTNEELTYDMAQLLGWETAADNADDFDQKSFADKISQEVELGQLNRVLHLALLVNKIDIYGWDEHEVSIIEPYLLKSNINVRGIIQQYCQETGYKLPE